jgi:innexin
MDVIKKIVNFNRTKKNRISNYIFRLNRAFAYICVVFSFLVSSKQFFGNPISCFGHMDQMKQMGEAINSYCWILGTYSSKDSFDGRIGHDFAHYGLGNVIKESDRNYQKYYQWIVFVFIIQAFAFYMPYYWWTVCDAGRIHMLCKDLSELFLKA